MRILLVHKLLGRQYNVSDLLLKTLQQRGTFHIVIFRMSARKVVLTLKNDYIYLLSM